MLLPLQCAPAALLCAQVADSLRRGFQAMVFVHSRKDTGKTARMLALKAQQEGEQAIFDCSEGEVRLRDVLRDVRLQLQRVCWCNLSVSGWAWMYALAPESTLLRLLTRLVPARRHSQ